MCVYACVRVCVCVCLSVSLCLCVCERAMRSLCVRTCIFNIEYLIIRSIAHYSQKKLEEFSPKSNHDAQEEEENKSETKFYCVRR